MESSQLIIGLVVTLLLFAMAMFAVVVLRDRNSFKAKVGALTAELKDVAETNALNRRVKVDSDEDELVYLAAAVNNLLHLTESRS